MAEALDGIASTVDQLNERVRELERRVSALEAPSASAVATPPESTSFALPRSRAPETWRGFPPASLPNGVLPVFGKAVLAIAGAYLLRAVAESGTIPRFPVLMLAIAYAGMWLFWSVRTHATNGLASITYAITAALILSPLLWESTVRFQILPPALTAAVLVAFFLLAQVLTWRQNLQVISWVATLAVVATSLALMVATRELASFTVALLALALATEAAACTEHRLSVRAIPALAADLAVLIVIFVMTSPDGAPQEYRPLSAGMLTGLCLPLLLIYGGSIAIRSFALRNRLTIFEIAQGVVAFAIATLGSLRASHGSLAPALGGFFLFVAAICYWGALSRFSADDQTRNRRVSATYAAVLLVAGSFMLFSPDLEIAFLCFAAVVAASMYPRTGKLSLGLHASFYLAAAAAVSPFLGYVESALAATAPASPDWRIWTVVVSAVLCYVLGSRVAEDRRQRRLLWVIPAVLSSLAGAALAIVAIASLTAGRIALSPSLLSVVRTIVTCLLALALGFLGPRSKRIELVWVAYATVAFGALKLLFEDLRFGNAGSLVVSLLFYGIILILIPRLTRLQPAA